MSGIILANASLDTAFHDGKNILKTNYKDNVFYYEFKGNPKSIDFGFVPWYSDPSVYFYGYVPQDLLGCNSHRNFSYSSGNKSPLCLKHGKLNDYVKQFWVGLLEGDGSIFVKRNRSSKVYAAFEISLKYLNENEELLKLISKHIGGNVFYEKKNKSIIKVKWAAYATKDVKNCLNILNKYPLLTSRKICQLEHLNKCLVQKDWDYHLKTRNKKYDLQKEIINSKNQEFIIPAYFNGWLSGFLEAEGSFRLRNNKATSFYISQNNDIYILNAIKNWFLSNHKIGIHRDSRYETIHYRISISGKPCISRIKEHFTLYPLLGHKRLSFNVWN